MEGSQYRSTLAASLWNPAHLEVPASVWAELFAARYGVSASQVTAAVAGTGGSRRFKVDVAARLVAEVGRRWGCDAAERVASGDTRQRVRSEVRAAPPIGREAASIRDAQTLAQLVLTDDWRGEVDRFHQRRLCVGADEFLEVLLCVAAFTDPGEPAVEAVAAAAPVLGSLWDSAESAEYSSAEVAPRALLGAAAAWAAAAGVELPASWVGRVPAAPGVDATAAVTVFCVLLATTSERWWWEVPELPDGLLAAASELCRTGHFGALWSQAGIYAAVAALIFEVTGSVDDTLEVFGVADPGSNPAVSDALFRRWFTARNAVLSRPSRFSLGAAPMSPRIRPLDPLLEVFSEGGSRVVEMTHECFSITTAGFTPWEASAFWSANDGFARDMAAEFATMCTGIHGHCWDPDEVLCVVGRRGPEFAERLWAVLPEIAGRCHRSGHVMPAALVEASMRTVGLGLWAQHAEELVVGELLAAASAAGLSDAGWASVWTLLPEFRGTPTELVEVAVATSPGD